MSLASADLHSDSDALRAFALACQSELAAATAAQQAAKLAVQLRTLKIEKLKLPDRRAAADAIRPLFGATGPANRAARTAARGAGSRQSRRSARLRQKTGRFRSGKETGQSESPCRTTCRAVRSCTNRCTTGPAPVLLAAATWPDLAKMSPKSSTVSRPVPGDPPCP